MKNKIKKKLNKKTTELIFNIEKQPQPTCPIIDNIIAGYQSLDLEFKKSNSQKQDLAQLESFRLQCDKIRQLTNIAKNAFWLQLENKPNNLNNTIKKLLILQKKTNNISISYQQELSEDINDALYNYSLLLKWSNGFVRLISEYNHNKVLFHLKYFNPSCIQQEG